MSAFGYIFSACDKNSVFERSPGTKLCYTRFWDFPIYPNFLKPDVVWLSTRETTRIERFFCYISSYILLMTNRTAQILHKILKYYAHDLITIAIEFGCWRKDVGNTNNIIFNIIKLVRPNGISVKLRKDLKHAISKHLVELNKIVFQC